jgi:xanthine dehydrogenase small subunit
VRFVHQGHIKAVNGLPPTTTVLQWLRENAHCTGTKEGCAEGDCGACTVVLGAPDANAPGGVALRTVNACIQFLPTLEGQALLSVEDLAPLNGGPLHPCQTAMVACHGSQCGFCTPGFVMSLWHLYETQARAPSRTEMADALSGNLCRCTGYRPILDAAQQMYEAPRAAPDLASIATALQTLAADSTSTFVYEGPDAANPAQCARFIAPASLNELAHWREQLPNARLLSGSTDIGLWVNKQFRALGDILYLGRVKALQTIGVDNTAAVPTLHIGAGASLEEAWSALSQHIPELREIWLRFASPPVRHAGTLGGNIANGSPIGDGPPVLLALNADVVLRQGAATRTLPLSSFYLDYMKNAMPPGEFIEALRVPLPREQEAVRAYKISKRHDSDISALCVGLWLLLDKDTITSARVAFGGMAATARRAPHIEATLTGQVWNEATLQRAQAAVAQDFQPLSDMRASANYRLQAAQGLLARWWLETRPHQALPSASVQVWPATT